MVEVVSSSAFAKHTWAEARARLLETKPTKYCDLNLVNLLRGAPEKLTLEVRTLPVHLTAGPIIDAAVLCERMLRWSLDAPDAKVEAERPPTPQAARELFTRVGLPDAEASRLLANLARPD